MLQVPLFYQPKDKPYCGPTCAKMILAYHGIEMDLDKIAAGMRMDKFGVNAASLGSFFLAQGFDVQFMVWLKEWPQEFLTDSEALRSWLRNKEIEMQQKEVNVDKDLEHAEKLGRSVPGFLKAGGSITAKPVSIQDLKNALRENSRTGKANPPIINLRMSGTMYGERLTKPTGHYVVPVFINDQIAVINDPQPCHGGIKQYNIEFVMHACYIWNSAALFIKPKT